MHATAPIGTMQHMMLGDQVLMGRSETRFEAVLCFRCVHSACISASLRRREQSGWPAIITTAEEIDGWTGKKGSEKMGSH